MASNQRLLCQLFLAALLLGGSLSLLSCGGGGAGGADLRALFVNADLGDDVAGDGSPEFPFRTITQALSISRAGLSIQVAPGTYDEGLGERFPLRVPADVQVVGDPAGRGAVGSHTAVVGKGPYTSGAGTAAAAAFVIEPGGALSGLIIEASDAIAVWVDGASAQPPVRVSSNTIRGSRYGVVMERSATVSLTENEINANSIVGVVAFDEVSLKLRRNTIRGNSTGVLLEDASTADLGSPTDPGINVLAGNTACDLQNATDIESVIFAIGNTWDDPVDAFATVPVCEAGANLVSEGRGAVVFQQVGLGESTIFAVEQRIDLYFPEQDGLLATDTPRFVWGATNRRLVFMAVSKAPLVVKENHILNAEQIVWAWHTGLGTGREGDVRYTDGVTVVDGNLVGGGAEPVPLTRGRTYFWSVWAWDDDGIHITEASREARFSVLN